MPISMTRVCEEAADHLPTCHQSQGRKPPQVFHVLDNPGQVELRPGQHRVEPVGMLRTVAEPVDMMRPELMTLFSQHDAAARLPGNLDLKSNIQVL